MKGNIIAGFFLGGLAGVVLGALGGALFSSVFGLPMSAHIKGSEAFAQGLIFPGLMLGSPVVGLLGALIGAVIGSQIHPPSDPPTDTDS